MSKDTAIYTAADLSAYLAPPAAAPTPAAYTSGAPLALSIGYVAPNPKKPGSAAHARYARYPTAPFTLAQVLAADPLGPNRPDFLYDLRHGYLRPVA